VGDDRGAGAGSIMSELDLLDEFVWGDLPLKGRRKYSWKRGGSKLTHCFRGHEFTAENTCATPGGRRVCKKCRRLWVLSQKEKRS
jgi:hypothetical protein